MRWRKVAAEHDRNACHALAADQPYLNGCFPVNSRCDRYKPPLNEVHLLHWCAPMVQDLPGLEFDRFEKRLNALDLVRWESLEQAIMDRYRWRMGETEGRERRWSGNLWRLRHV